MLNIQVEGYSIQWDGLRLFVHDILQRAASTLPGSCKCDGYSYPIAPSVADAQVVLSSYVQCTFHIQHTQCNATEHFFQHLEQTFWVSGKASHGADHRPSTCSIEHPRTGGLARTIVANLYDPACSSRATYRGGHRCSS